MNWRRLTIAVGFIGFLFPLVGQARAIFGDDDDGDCERQSLSEFLEAQGSRGSSFFTGPPPFDDIVGWGDNPFTTFGIGDYAGVWNENAGGVFGTRVRGRVIECELDDDGNDDDKVRIEVVLRTRNAIAFAQDADDLRATGFDFNSTLTNFGAKPADVVNDGAEPALGRYRVRATFIMSEDDPLPDLLDVIQSATTANFAPVSIDFRLSADGKRPDQSEACLIIKQVAASDDTGALVFTEEVVDIIDGQCN